MAIDPNDKRTRDLLAPPPGPNARKQARYASRKRAAGFRRASVWVSEDVWRELLYMVELHKQYGAPRPMQSVEQLVGAVLSSVADGSRRPGSWERGMLGQMGLVADCPEHHVYRANYGKPSEGDANV